MTEYQFQLLPAGILRLDEAYQRETKEARAAAMAADFRPELLGVIEVAQRDGAAWVIDGGHRVRAAILAKGADYLLPCKVWTETKQAAEAAQFVGLQTGRRSLKAIDLYRADLVAGDPTAVLVDQALGLRGLGVGTTRAPYTIASAATLMQIVRTYGAKWLGETLDVLLEAWPDSRGGARWEQVVMSGMALFLFANRDAGLKRSRLIARLQRVSPVALVQRAEHTVRGRPAARQAVAIAREYNVGLHAGQMSEDQTFYATAPRRARQHPGARLEAPALEVVNGGGAVDDAADREPDAGAGAQVAEATPAPRRRGRRRSAGA